MRSATLSPEGERETARAALTAAAARFTFSQTPRLDAELILAHTLGIPRERLLLTLADQPVPPDFAALVERRAQHEPVAYITGTRAFWTIDVEVAPGVLIPRADSETLIEAAVDHFAGTPGPRAILDLGTGSGALLLAALDQWPDATGVGIDASPAALAIAARNAERIAPGRATASAGGWKGTGRRFDLVLCNPPYVSIDAEIPPEVSAFEPASALFAGPDGLDDYHRIAPLLGAQLAPGGVACIEIGSDQRDAASAIFAAAGLTVAVRQDLAGLDRCLIVTS
ncbi:peptide chain release factor N(5)-glutamine methyltransferase [Sphingomonas radiodurans]|uniref:peptide chain release factor N(5)-glutamine methyltransferase n=1 Tax=Sphingomonas radiodurans TaxID=2890321 RepID=UPI001E3FA14B|nr:peptide chain release factor N(5)-glutamine methyltransferase [Sphingomonas radiodurans]WBH18313.1 peptide chain release factor N(5)-glutamine methyltransferase [Sphingomonas radiodurans]